MAAVGWLSSILTDTLPGIRVVKAFAQEERGVDKFVRSNERLQETNLYARASAGSSTR